MVRLSAALAVALAHLKAIRANPCGSTVLIDLKDDITSRFVMGAGAVDNLVEAALSTDNYIHEDKWDDNSDREARQFPPWPNCCDGNLDFFAPDEVFDDRYGKPMDNTKMCVRGDCATACHKCIYKCNHHQKPLCEWNEDKTVWDPLRTQHYASLAERQIKVPGWTFYQAAHDNARNYDGASFQNFVSKGGLLLQYPAGEARKDGLRAKTFTHGGNEPTNRTGFALLPWYTALVNRQQRDRQDVHYSEPYIGGDTGELQITASKGIYSRDEPDVLQGGIAIDIILSYITDPLALFSSTDNQYAFMIDGSDNGDTKGTARWDPNAPKQQDMAVSTKGSVLYHPRVAESSDPTGGKVLNWEILESDKKVQQAVNAIVGTQKGSINVNIVRYKTYKAVNEKGEICGKYFTGCRPATETERWAQEWWKENIELSCVNLKLNQFPAVNGRLIQTNRHAGIKYTICIVQVTTHHQLHIYGPLLIILFVIGRLLHEKKKKAEAEAAAKAEEKKRKKERKKNRNRKKERAEEKAKAKITNIPAGFRPKLGE